MYYRLTCPCGVAHSVSTSQAGQEIHCTCGNSLQVPTLRGLKELPPVDPATAPEVRYREAGHSRRPWILLGTMFVLIFLSVPTAIFFGWQRMKLDTSLTQESDEQQAFAQLDAAGPLVLSELWESYETLSLGPPNKPLFYHIQQKARALNFRIAMACGIALLAAVVAAAVLVMQRERRSTPELQ
ncbi:MAG: hypothetical protein ACTHK7_06895 [Aureliella sp.]